MRSKRARRDPRFFPALLHKARLLERQGKRKAAAQMYHAFLCCVPSGVPQPPAVRARWKHAHKAFEGTTTRALEAFLRPRVEQARARHAGARFDRFDACSIRSSENARVRAAADFMLFPRLPAIEFLEREQLPWLDSFEAAAAEIRAEAHARAREGGGRLCSLHFQARRALRSTNGRNSIIEALEHIFPDQERACASRTISRNARGRRRCWRPPRFATIPGHAPTAFFSVLAPKTRIPGHTGVTNTPLHRAPALTVPPSCGSSRRGRDAHLAGGRAWVFGRHVRARGVERTATSRASC
jgi:hypothetical protein